MPSNRHLPPCRVHPGRGFCLFFSFQLPLKYPITIWFKTYPSSLRCNLPPGVQPVAMRACPREPPLLCTFLFSTLGFRKCSHETRLCIMVDGFKAHDAEPIRVRWLKRHPMICSADCLSRGFVRRRTSTVLTSIAATHRQSTHARGEKCEWIIFRLSSIEVAAVIGVVRWTGRGRTIASSLKGGLGGSAIKRGRRVRSRGRAKVCVQGRVRSSTSADARWQSICTRRSSEVLAVIAGSPERAASRGEGPGSWSTSHGVCPHAIIGTAVHRRWVTGIGHHGSTSST